MVEFRLLDATERTPGREARAKAEELTARLPRLMLEARRVQAAVAGVHGRRRAGTGETFWQFRPFSSGEAAQRIDWRRSGRDDRLYVREREWEAAHSVHLWIDRSASMGYGSSLAQTSKMERAFVLGFALADALVDAGERVGLLGLMPPRASRHIVERMAERLVHDLNGFDTDQPDATPMPAQSEVVLITDALVSIETFSALIHSLSARGARGHLVRIIDPVEETFPFTGEAILEEVEGARDLRIGDAAAWGRMYRDRFAAHGAALAKTCAARGWTITTHRTDRPVSEPALRLMTMLAQTGQALASAGGR